MPVAALAAVVFHLSDTPLLQFDAGMRDGVRAEQELSVDGFPFRPQHSDFVTDLREVGAGAGARG